MTSLASPPASDLDQRTHVTIEQYRNFRRDGFLVFPQLVSQEEVAELRQHTEDLMQGKLPQQQSQMQKRDVKGDTGLTGQGLEAPPEDLSPQEKAQYFLRIHMLHRRLELHERYLLHPRVLDVLEVLIGPDVMAMQTMLFLKPPGKPGQGWHQDSYYIPTLPDTLCGAWIAIDDCDEQNGAMWFAKGSGHEPIYPPCPEYGYGFGDKAVSDIVYQSGVSDTNDQANTLSRVADRYDQVLVSAKAGDVVFFNGHVLHRSKQNWSKDRFRRAFVSHYANARSYTQWGADIPRGWNGGDGPDGNGAPPEMVQEHRRRVDPESGATNGSHILARGDTQLPFAEPRFGTPCAATLSPEERKTAREYIAAMMQNNDSGLMGCSIQNVNELTREAQKKRYEAERANREAKPDQSGY